MSTSASRRSFLATSAGGAATWWAIQHASLLPGLPTVSAEEAQPSPDGVRFSSDIEPLVRQIEETPRESLLEKIAERIRAGESYQQIVGALLLAGIRNVQPRPAVGFKFHAVLVVNSAHLASLASSAQHRWLPIFWALDYFKEAQAQDTREGNWTMARVDESRVPPAHQARALFIEAMDSWDVEKADVAAAALARSASSGELFDLFARYGARDYRSIGHKAIYVANAWRTLSLIGWRHAEPVLRSLAYAILNHSGEPNPSMSDLEPDRAFRRNSERLAKLPAHWTGGKLDDGASRQLLTTLRAGTSEDVAQQVVEMLSRGVSPQSIWDALLVGSGELLMRQPGIVGLHTLTTSNAMRHAFDFASSDEVRRLVLLQNASFLPLFRKSMEQRGAVQSLALDQLEPLPLAADQPPLDAIFGPLHQDRLAAARRTLAAAQENAGVEPFFQRARELVFLKGRDSHDYKFSSAVLEDFYHVSPAWRARFLAASVYHLRGAGLPDNPLVARTIAALGKQS
jgi:hypothetical protein